MSDIAPDALSPEPLSPHPLSGDPADRLDEDDRFEAAFVRDVVDAADEGDDALVQALTEPLHPSDLADLIELVPEGDRLALAAALGPRLTGEVLAEMNDYVREALLSDLPAHQVAGFAAELDTDDAVAIIEDLDADDQRAVLDALPAAERTAIESALAYPEETAGRIMQREVVAVRDGMTVGDVIDWCRSGAATGDFWEIFVVDPAHRPIGTCQLSWILTAPRQVPVSDLMKRDQTLIPATMDQEEVALRFQRYNLISAAVVDESGRLIGQVTVDDIVHVIQEEAGEDVLLLSGAGEGDINEPIRESYKARVRWLIANMGTALVGSTIIWLFGAAIEQMVALAVLMPIVASIGGNAGTQTMAVSVRAISLNQLTQSNTTRIIVRELRVAVLNGATVAVLIGLAAAAFFSNPLLGGVIALAMVLNIIVAGLAGVVVPVVLDRLDQDPAVASSIFVTMITDSIGFLAFLGLAVASGLVGGG